MIEIEYKNHINFIKNNYDKIKLPLYNVKGYNGIYTIKEFKKNSHTIMITYINTKNETVISNIKDINNLFLKNIYIKMSDLLNNTNIWED